MSVLATETRLRGKHILAIFLGFFGIVFAVNSIFVYAALSTRPGEESGASYEKGLHYNEMLIEQRAQDALQWRHKAQILSGSRLRIAITNAEGAPVAGLTFMGSASRPASNEADRDLQFREAETGVYETDIRALMTGSWVLAFVASQEKPGSEPAIYRVKERLWLSATR